MNPIFKTNLRKLAEEKPPANRRLARYQIEINARPGDGLFMRGDDYNKTFPRLVNAIPLDFGDKIENDMIKFMYVSTGSAHMYVSKYITQFDAKKLYRGLIHSVSTEASSIKGFGNSKDFLCTIFLAKVDAINGKAVSRRTVLLKNLISGADVGCNDKIRNSVDNIEDFRDAEHDAEIEGDEDIEEGLETITEEPLPDEQASIYTDRKEMDMQSVTTLMDSLIDHGDESSTVITAFTADCDVAAFDDVIDKRSLPSVMSQVHKFNVAIEDLQNECATLQSTEYMCVLNVYGVAGPRWPGGGWRLSPSYYTNHFPRFLNEPGLENIKWRYLNEGSHTFVSTATSGREGEECYEQFLRALENKEIQRQLFGESNDWEITTVFSSRSMTTVAQTNKDGTRKALIRKSIMVKMENFEGVFRDGSIIFA
ncbi:uncharacterized protein LOC117124839 [Anneissia japonica]|uniref:uncharacterized protein LOC117124839 n=1 Tax=Anneissia japonica TaxID=1529436 RepID=UPI0014254CF8|nr:uncharacterized protein LOC117124839 [Anneissia japonica]